jgi:hypothetical protein
MSCPTDVQRCNVFGDVLTYIPTHKDIVHVSEYIEFDLPVISTVVIRKL